MDFKNLKLKNDNSYNSIIINNKEVRVYQASTYKDKQDLIGMVLSEGFKDGSFDLLEAKKAFDLGIIALYTDIQIPPEDSEEDYDLLYQSGLMNRIFKEMNQNELKLLEGFYKDCVDYQLQYGYSFIGFAKELLTEIPDKVKDATKELENFDPEQYKELMAFAKSVNGDRLPVDMEDESFVDMAVNKVKGKLN